MAFLSKSERGFLQSVSQLAYAILSSKNGLPASARRSATMEGEPCGVCRSTSPSVPAPMCGIVAAASGLWRSSFAPGSSAAAQVSPEDLTLYEDAILHLLSAQLFPFRGRRGRGRWRFYQEYRAGWVIALSNRRRGLPRGTTLATCSPATARSSAPSSRSFATSSRLDPRGPPARRRLAIHLHARHPPLPPHALPAHGRFRHADHRPVRHSKELAARAIAQSRYVPSTTGAWPSPTTTRCPSTRSISPLAHAGRVRAVWPSPRVVHRGHRRPQGAG